MATGADDSTAFSPCSCYQSAVPPPLTPPLTPARTQGQELSYSDIPASLAATQVMAGLKEVGREGGGAGREGEGRRGSQKKRGRGRG